MRSDVVNSDARFQVRAMIENYHTAWKRRRKRLFFSCVSCVFIMHQLDARKITARIIAAHGTADAQQSARLCSGHQCLCCATSRQAFRGVESDVAGERTDAIAYWERAMECLYAAGEGRWQR
jgi:hypothetical protein